MRDITICKLIRLAIAIFFLCGILVCFIWYPFSISLSVIGTVNVQPTTIQNIQMWTQLVFYWFVSIPCFVILIIIWLVAGSIKKNQVYERKNIYYIKVSLTILFLDLIIYLIGNIIFLILGWNDFAIVYFIIFLIGVAILALIKVLEKYFKDAIIMHDDTEGLI